MEMSSQHELVLKELSDQNGKRILELNNKLSEKDSQYQELLLAKKSVEDECEQISVLTKDLNAMTKKYNELLVANQTADAKLIEMSSKHELALKQLSDQNAKHIQESSLAKKDIEGKCEIVAKGNVSENPEPNETLQHEEESDEERVKKRSNENSWTHLLVISRQRNQKAAKNLGQRIIEENHKSVLTLKIYWHTNPKTMRHCS